MTSKKIHKFRIISFGITKKKINLKSQHAIRPIHLPSNISTRYFEYYQRTKG